jgi:3-dehydroquinate synthase
LTTEAETMPPIRIEVSSSAHPYTVWVGHGLLADVPRLLAEAKLTNPVVVSVPPVWKRHAERLEKVAGADGPVMMADGERAKTLVTVSRLYDAFAKRGVTRSSTIVAFGGGVTGDTVGFAAATYLRGIPIVHVPTTLLAQVDSAIGGKVGVNLPLGKNLAGAFYPPALVVCDPDVLSTLPRREFRAGLYEVVKYGVTLSAEVFQMLEQSLDDVFKQDADVLRLLIARSSTLKADVVSRDEHEAGQRRVLNFGHTIGHSLEAITEFRRFRHGEAIAYGMLAAADISAKRGLMSDDDHKRLADLIQRMGPLPPVADLARDETLQAMQLDKKIVNGRLHFVLCAGIGQSAVATDVTPRELTAALKSIGISR